MRFLLFQYTINTRGKVIRHNKHLNCTCFSLKVTLSLCGNAEESGDWIEKSGSVVRSRFVIKPRFYRLLMCDWRMTVWLVCKRQHRHPPTSVDFSELRRFGTRRVFIHFKSAVMYYIAGTIVLCKVRGFMRVPLSPRALTSKMHYLNQGDSEDRRLDVIQTHQSIQIFTYVSISQRLRV